MQEASTIESAIHNCSGERGLIRILESGQPVFHPLELRMCQLGSEAGSKGEEEMRLLPAKMVQHAEVRD